MRASAAARCAAGIAMVLMILSVGLTAGQDKPAETGKLALSVEYTGKGAVDKDHRIWLWLFDTPNITAESTPLAFGDLSENGGTYKFTGLPKEVYLAGSYDEKGGYDGTAGPPPQGAPIFIYGMASGGTAAPITTGGDDATLKTTFDDSVRMP